ncbi:MAG: ABC transporter permease [Nitrospinaceae bacterium]|nr:MAG: ABC transporter permease [Nitrospinaceae bacterium]
MIRWIYQGIIRDKTRSLFAFLVITAGVSMMIFFLGFMDGIFAGMVDMTANLDTGHVRFVNRPFYEEEYMSPMDRALAAEKEMLRWLEENADPRIRWSARIRWAAIMDVPDDRGETLHQTPVLGMAMDLLSADSPELERLKLADSLLAGRLPEAPRELLAGHQLAETLNLELGRPVTLLGQSFDGGLAVDNYTVVGFVKFGVAAMDKKMALIDIADAQDTFYMQDMVTDWLGYLPAEVDYRDYPEIQARLQERLPELMAHPPAAWAGDDDPMVLSILDQRNFSSLVRTFETVKKIVVGIFLFLMTLVLWNAGLLNGIHRYGEMGLRLALGETHRALVFRLGVEAFMIGVLGSLAGCLIGGVIVYYLQEVGINMGDAFAKTGLMLSDVVRGRLSLQGFIMGIVPGMTASVLGSLIASLAVFKRSEATLFRELEAG